jgi:membrane protease YdiL (CAAX protease family)
MLVAALIVVAAIDLPLRALGDQLARQASANPVLTLGAARYATIVTARLVEVLAVLLGLAVLFRVTRAGAFRQLGLGRVGRGGFWSGAMLAIAALAVALLLLSSVGLLRPDRIQSPGPWPVLLAFSAALHAAVIEELVFRSLLLQIVEQLAGRIAAVVVTALLFVLMHLLAPFKLSLAWWIVVAVAGVGLAWAFFASRRNLWLLIGVHLGFDLGVFLLFGLPGETRGAVLWPDMTPTPALSPAAGWVLLLAAAMTAAGLLSWLRRGRA